MEILTPGPTQVAENVRLARARACTNPDIDPDFCEFYHETCKELSELLHTDNESLILGGEGILGLEAAIATLTEPGDRVLVIDNGIFGKGNADFVKIYGGKPVLYSVDYRRPIDLEALRHFLENDHDFAYATLVHVDTPTGVVNDVISISNLLNEYGILVMCDAVASMFGEPLDISRGHLDVVCGGSQKALSAPPGLTMVTISPRAWEKMDRRRTPVASFYCNLETFRTYYENKWFPYTMPISDINGLRVALDNVRADPGIYERHARIAVATRMALTAAGIPLFLEDGFATTVTAIDVPASLSSPAILSYMKEQEGVMLSGSLAEYTDRLIRIGHMGENARPQKVVAAFVALQHAFEHFGYELRANLVDEFYTALN